MFILNMNYRDEHRDNGHFGPNTLYFARYILMLSDNSVSDVLGYPPWDDGLINDNQMIWIRPEWSYLKIKIL